MIPEQSPAKPGLQLTFFKDEKASVAFTETLTPDALREKILDTRAGQKSKLPWLRLAVFGDKRSDGNCLRTTENLIAVTGIEVDYDGGVATFEAACAKLRGAGLNCIVYTTPQNKDDNHRWRVLLPFSHAMPCDDIEARIAERATYTFHVESVLGHYCAFESGVIAQGWYFGAADDIHTDLRCEVIRGGAFIDQLESYGTHVGERETEHRARGGGALFSAREARENIEAGREVHYSLLSLTRKWAELGYDEQRIRAEIEALEPIIAANHPAGQQRVTQMHRGELDRLIGGAWSEAPDFEVIEEEEYDPAPALDGEFWNAGEYVSRALPAWLVPDVFHRKGLVAIYGEPGCGKSALAMAITMAMAGGADDVLGSMPVWDRGAALYVAMEGSVRLRSQPYYHTGKVYEPRVRFEEHVNLMHDGIDFLRRRLKQAKERDPSLALCVIDTLARASVGVDENSTELGAIAGRLHVLAREFDVCMIVVHHSGKDASKGMRGSSSLKGAVDTEIEVTTIDGPSKMFKVTKQRDGEMGREYAFDLVTVDMGHYPGHADRPVTGIMAMVKGLAPPRTDQRPREPKGDTQRLVLRVLRAMVADAEGPVHYDDLIKAATLRLPPMPRPKGDRRREVIQRAVQNLCATGFAKMFEGDLIGEYTPHK